MMPQERSALMWRLFDNYRRLQKLEKGYSPALPDLIPVAVSFANSGRLPPGSSPLEGAWARAAEIAAEHDHGWARRRSGVWELLKDGAEALAAREGGPPLWGEWASDDGTSVHLRPDANELDAFSFCTITEKRLQEGEEPTGNAQVLLTQEVAVIREPEKPVEPGQPREPADLKKAPVLLYHVYWGGDDDPHAIRRLFARFAGFATRNVAIEEPQSAARRDAKRTHRVERVEEAAR